MAMATDSSQLALLRLLQLTSPALPVGAYAYSQGLETAVEHGWVTDEAGIEAWITGLLRHPLCHQDVPLFARLYQAWVDRDTARVAHWNAWLHASREAAELQREDQHLGTALARLLAELDLNEATHWRTASRVCFATLFSLAAARWGIELETAVQGYLWAWAENQVMAAAKLLPLGQTASQRLLSRSQPAMVAAARRGLALSDTEIGCAAPGLGLASALHETQYSRLFRS